MTFTPEKMRGIKPSPCRRPATLGATPVQPYSAWAKVAIPTYSQRYDDCDGHATANWVEMMLRRHVGRSVFADGEQINGEAIWRHARKMFFPNEPVEGGGLYLEHGFLAAIDMGILPPDSGVTTVHLDIGMVSRMLRTEPVLQGNAVHNGWSRAKSNGQIPLDLPNPKAGHATVIVGVLKQGDHYYVMFQNSWGATWGYGGFGLLRDDQWEQCLLGPVAVCKLPDNWTEWKGWMDYVIKV